MASYFINFFLINRKEVITSAVPPTPLGKFSSSKLRHLSENDKYFLHPSFSFGLQLMFFVELRSPKCQARSRL